MPYTRTDNAVLDLDNNWKDHAEPFAHAQRILKQRRRGMLNRTAKTLAATYKQELDLFPCHFEFDGVSYELYEPKQLKALGKRDRKKHVNVRSALLEIAQYDDERFAMLIVGLVTAQKIDSWLYVEDDEDPQSG